MKGGIKIRKKLWEIFKTHEPPSLSDTVELNLTDIDRLFLRNDSLDSLLTELYKEYVGYKVTYKYYLQFLKKYSVNYALIAGDDKFSDFLKNYKINAINAEISDLNYFLNFTEEFYSAVVLINCNKYLKKNEILDFITKVYKKLEYGGILLTELPDWLIDKNSFITPEYFESLCKKAKFRDTRIYKTPVNKEGIYYYLVVSRKI